MPAQERIQRVVVEQPPFIRLDSFRDVSHGISTRHGGVSPVPFATFNMGIGTADSPINVWNNRSRFVERLGVKPENIAFARLTHSTEVSAFRRNCIDDLPLRENRGPDDGSRMERAFCTDGVVSDVPDLHFFLTFADCVPLLFHDPKRNAVGAAHAGWRGTAGGMSIAVVHAMREAFGSNPRDIRAGIGPSIGPCCYPVREEVLQAFKAAGSQAVTIRRKGHVSLDLWRTNEEQLMTAGLLTEHIESPRICTSCRVDHFYSHRAERGRTGRFALCIGL